MIKHSFKIIVATLACAGLTSIHAMIEEVVVPRLEVLPHSQVMPRQSVLTVIKKKINRTKVKRVHKKQLIALQQASSIAEYKNSFDYRYEMDCQAKELRRRNGKLRDAAWQGDFLGAKYWVKLGADINNEEQPILALLLRCKHRQLFDAKAHEFLTWFIDEGVNVNTSSKQFNESVLSLALKVCAQIECVKGLLDAGAKVGSIELAAALATKDISIVQAVLDADDVLDVSNITIRVDHYDELTVPGFQNKVRLRRDVYISPFEYAQRVGYNHDELAQLLALFYSKSLSLKDFCDKRFKEYGVSIEIKDGLGRTPLFAAVDAGRIGLAEKLVKSGADIYATNPDGVTCLDRASRNDANFFRPDTRCFKTMKAALLPNERFSSNKVDHDKLKSYVTPPFKPAVPLTLEQARERIALIEELIEGCPLKLAYAQQAVEVLKKQVE